MPRLLLTLLAALLLSAPAQAGSLFSGHSVHKGDGPVVDGDGHVVTQARQLGGFDTVEMAGPVEVDIHIGPETAVTVEFDDNLLDCIGTTVRGKTLLIDSTASWSSEKDPRVHISLPALNAVASTGSGSLHLSGLNGGALALRLGGSGDMVAVGKLDRLALLLNGSGDAKLYPLHVGSAKVRLNGSGDIELDVQDTLEASIYGTGDVKYHGDPQVTSQVYGTGEVLKR